MNYSIETGNALRKSINTPIRLLVFKYINKISCLNVTNLDYSKISSKKYALYIYFGPR